MAVASDSARAIGFKGRMMTLTVLEVNDLDLARVEQSLAEHIQRSPDFFRDMPVLLSLPNAPIDLPPLLALLRGHALVPVAVTDPSPEVAEAARSSGLGILSGATSAEKPPKSESAEVPQPGPPQHEPAANGAARVVDTPVRSGKQVYARGTDLVINAAVSEGAEVLADGHIHVYGALRGRAIAGASGDSQARIYCSRFEPDLIAIAGCYKVADDMEEAVRGKAVRARLAGESLVIEVQE